MPATRKTRHSAGSAKQSTLTFNGRVTKNPGRSGTDVVKKTLEVAETHLALPKATEDVENIKFEGIGDEHVDHEESAEKSESHRKATKITDKAIEKYWRQLESERTAKRVHQEDLLTGEKILRFFDVSSQYGPCVGSSRLRRWERAERLGLHPPIEVLAVLLKQTKENRTSQQAHIDYILNSTAVGST